MVIQDHKHNMVLNRRFVYKLEFACVPKDPDLPGAQEYNENWGCNYTQFYSKKWVRNKVQGLELEKKRPGHAQVKP